MNGRIYDPRLGRFLSPDPYIQAYGYTQSYNRYSYVWNNPMKFTDPSGYFVETDFLGRQKYDKWGMYIPANMRTGGMTEIIRPPGYGLNGSGLNGSYYDWYSGTYQSAQGAFNWMAAYNALKPFGITIDPADYRNFQLAKDGSGFWYDEPLGYEFGSNKKLDDKHLELKGTGIRTVFVAWEDLATNNKGENDSFSNSLTYLGWVNSLLESLTSQTAYDLENARYAVKGQNLAKQAKFMSKLSARLSVAEGFIAIADNAYQAYQAYNNGQYIVAGLQAFQAYHYAVGTGMLFVPITAPFGQRF